MYICVRMGIYVYISINMYIYVYIYIYITHFNEGKIYFWTWWLCRPNESSISVAFKGINVYKYTGEIHQN